MLGLLASALLALPESQQYAASSLPAAIATSLTAGEDLYGVRRFRASARSLWLVTLPCRSETEGCRQVLFLQQGGKAFRQVGRAKGDLVDADPDSGIPEELSFHVPNSKRETELRWSGERYETHEGPRWFRDPLTRDRISPEELHARALLDLQSGRATAAAGRYALLCQDPCPVLDVESLAAALLEAHLLEQAESALKKAIAMPGHQPRDFESLASLLRAEGRDGEAASIEGQGIREPGDGGR